MTTNSTDHLDARPCPDCGVQLRGPLLSRTRNNYDPNGPLWKDTPLERLTAMATETDIEIIDIPKDDTNGLAGVIAAGHKDVEELHAIIFLAKDLDDDTRADVLAFAIAVFAGETDRITNQPNGYIGITRDRLPPTKQGAGHLAWHMLWTCGRTIPSATFNLAPIYSA
jgi:hypothetical protein